MPDINNMAGGELTQLLNKLTQDKSNLRKEYQKAIKIASDAQADSKIIKIKISQIADDIAACKFNIKAEANN